jgi:hypothetical protein
VRIKLDEASIILSRILCMVYMHGDAAIPQHRALDYSCRVSFRLTQYWTLA